MSLHETLTYVNLNSRILEKMLISTHASCELIQNVN